MMKWPVATIYVLGLAVRLFVGRERAARKYFWKIEELLSPADRGQ